MILHIVIVEKTNAQTSMNCSTIPDNHREGKTKANASLSNYKKNNNLFNDTPNIIVENARLIRHFYLKKVIWNCPLIPSLVRNEKQMQTRLYRTV